MCKVTVGYTEVTCRKCHGTGKLPEFNHIKNGQCFVCLGTGKTRRAKKAKVDPVTVVGTIEWQNAQINKLWG